MSYDASISLITNPKLINVFNFSNKLILDQYKLAKKMVRNKIITFHTETHEYGILDKKNITIEDMTKIGLKKEALEKELAQLKNKTDGHLLLLNILKETYEELISSFPETNPEDGGRGKKSRKYKSNKSKSRKSRKNK
jgi:hypothetical protein